jgi:hypothetical protein
VVEWTQQSTLPGMCSTRPVKSETLQHQDSPVTPSHVPSLLLISGEQGMRADPQLALRDLDLCTLAGGLLARSLS